MNTAGLICSSVVVFAYVLQALGLIPVIENKKVVRAGHGGAHMSPQL
jgi:hypothetical protein